MNNEPKCGKCGGVMTRENSRHRPELFLHDACLPDELRPMTPTAATSPPEPYKTLEEAKAFNDGFKAGATAYAVKRGDSGLRSKNAELREVVDAQGWKTIEAFEAIQAESQREARDPLPEIDRQRAAVTKFLAADGHELCHENRKELAAAFGIDLGKEPWPTLPPETEFRQRCDLEREKLYGMDGPREGEPS